MAKRTTYVAVPAEQICSFLESKGFRRVEGLIARGKHGGEVPITEIVYERSHDLYAPIKVRVFTSIREGNDRVRRRAKDSIKVCTVIVGKQKTYGIGKFPRVHRTGSPEKVLDRMLGRMREAYQRGTDWYREQAIKDVLLA